jgi:histone-lysine N-methyltransferase SETMAR
MEIQKKSRGMLTYSVLVVFLHDSVPRYISARTRARLEHFNWELFDHSPYSPDPAPRDYHLLTRTYLKNWLGSQRFNSNELMEGIKTRLS